MLLSENTKQIVHVYESMGECGAAVLETELRVIEHIATKRSDDHGLRYVSLVYRHLQVSFNPANEIINRGNCARK